MGFTYLNDKYWTDITRDERFFCAELYFEIKERVKDFVKWLNTKTDLELEEDAEWEIGYEVCFYRDYFKYFFPNKAIKPSKYPQKRTFDLCLFSDKEMVIIEAKAQTGFDSEQNEIFKRDKKRINKILIENGKEPVNVKLLGICSDKYIENDEIYGRAGNLEIFKGKLISWKELYIKYNNKILLKADNTYKN